MAPEPPVKPVGPAAAENQDGPAQEIFPPERAFTILLGIAAQKKILALNPDDAV
jgi:hypothetical protein